jgi:hypothetical protein
MIPRNRLDDLFSAAALIVCVLMAVGTGPGPTAAQESAPAPIGLNTLKQAAANSLWRLKRAAENDGFYNARVALNVWRSNAIDAGTFKQEDYDRYKKQIYQKSIESNRRCVELSVADENFTDARRCLHTWRIHSEEIGVFDPAAYESMQNLLLK